MKEPAASSAVEAHGPKPYQQLDPERMAGTKWLGRVSIQCIYKLATAKAARTATSSATNASAARRRRFRRKADRRGLMRRPLLAWRSSATFS